MDNFNSLDPTKDYLAGGYLAGWWSNTGILPVISDDFFAEVGYKVYENMMIDLQMTNKKLVERSKKIVMTITGVSYEEAEEYLIKSKGHVKTALVMILAKVDYDEAQLRLKKADGFVRKAISDN